MTITDIRQAVENARSEINRADLMTGDLLKLILALDLTRCSGRDLKELKIKLRKFNAGTKCWNK